MKDLLRSEIRRILLGYIAFDEEQHLIAAERSERLRLLGLFNGTGAAGVFGVSVRRRRYSAGKENLPIEESCRDAFAQMGRRVSLDTEPELLAVFYSPLLFNPSVLTAEWKEERLEISVYTARTLTVRVNAAHAFRKWRQNMPDGLREKPAEEMNARRNVKILRKNEARRRQKQQPADAAKTESEDDPKV